MVTSRYHVRENKQRESDMYRKEMDMKLQQSALEEREKFLKEQEIDVNFRRQKVRVIYRYDFLLPYTFE